MMMRQMGWFLGLALVEVVGGWIQWEGGEGMRI